MTLKLKPVKVIKIGYSRLVTLPLEWINHHKLMPGSKLLPEISDDGSYSLIIKPMKEVKNVQNKTEETRT
jgi:hypothetical protein